MADGRFVLPGPETVTMSGDTARRLIGCGSGDAALLYLYILTSGGRYDREDAASHTGRSAAQMDTAMDVLTRLGLVNPPGNGGESRKLPERPDELPEYTSEDISRELNNGESFKSLVNEVQHALGRLLSSDDLIKLFGIYDYLGLPPDVILQLVMHCREECVRRSGPGRVPTMRYIEKAAYTWEREGIFSLEAAEAYLMRLSEHRSAQQELASVLGIAGRPLSSSECRYLDSWTDMGFKADAVAIAYDKTVLKTGRLTWRYMDSIIKSWHSKGLHTPAEIESGDSPRYKKPEPSPNPAVGSGSGSATAEELDRMRETLKRIKGEE
ncbi:MAG: DnaD domain protein [Oscillospiraceae bacterium]